MYQSYGCGCTFLKGDTFRIDGNRLRKRGTSFGYGDSDPYLVLAKGHFALIRKPGSKDWCQLGDTRYSPSAWILVKADITPDSLIIIDIIDYREPGRFWKRARRELVEVMGLDVFP